MKKIYFILTAMAVVLSGTVKAQIAAWRYDASGNIISVQSPKDPNLQIAELSRGTGLTSGTVGYGYYSSVSGAVSNTKTDAETSGDYYQVKLKAVSGTLTITKINYRIYRHANGPRKFQWRYSTDGTQFNDLGTEIVMASSDTQADLSSIDLSLINLSNTITVTFRLIGYDVQANTNKNFGIRSNNSAALSFEGSLSTTLPVNLTSFTAKPKANAVQLNWQTASEQNNARFDVLRSTDGINFIKIGQKVGAGNSTLTQSYSYLDTKPLVGTSYYALKQYDLNGDSKQYDAVPVKFNLSSNLITATATSSGIKVSINAEKGEKASLSIYDISGTRLADRQVDLNQGFNEVEVNSFNLVSGKLYLVKLKTAIQNQTVKVIK